MTTELIVLDTPEMKQLSTELAEQIKETFRPMAVQVSEMEPAFLELTSRATVAITPELSAEARTLRLSIAKVRSSAEAARVKAKESSLVVGRAIDGASNILKKVFVSKESQLEEIEKHAERMEAERLAKILEGRAIALLALNLPCPPGIAEMADEVWEVYFAAREREVREAIEAQRVEALRRADEDRARETELARTRAIAPFSAFVEPTLLLNLGSRSDIEFEAILLRARTLKEEHDAEMVQQQARRLELDREETRLREARQAEADRITEANRKAEGEAAALKAAEQVAAQAPVKARLNAWIDTFALPELPGEYHETAEVIRTKFAQFITWAHGTVGQ